jgi:hypothetical protein
MRTHIEKAVQVQLQAVGLKKLPPAVVTAIIDAVSNDMAAALAKSVGKRTAPKALARVFAECVLGGGARDSKGSNAPFGQLPCANPVRDETTRLIGTHSDIGDELLKQEIQP